MHLSLLKSNVTNCTLQEFHCLPQKLFKLSPKSDLCFPITSLVLHLGKQDFHGLQEKFKLSPKPDLWLPGINMELNIL